MANTVKTATEPNYSSGVTDNATVINPENFQQRLLAWFDLNGRKDLPWQRDISPYRVWLSEIMLQQTQVATVIPYFLAFIAKLPDVESLAQAHIDEVLQLWSGLGYYARARNLHKAAQLIHDQGRFPDTLEELTALPGIGQSTAGAILSIAFNHSQPILDGNVKRVLARFQAIPGWPGNSEVNCQLWDLSATFTPTFRVAAYTQAIMDLGATVCTRSKPACERCPLASDCVAKLLDRAADFPASRPNKALPIKQSVLLILHHQQRQVFLEKRPPSGIWGGLWSLPEFANEQAAIEWCHQQAMVIVNQQTGAIRRHTFSHFHLDYTPLTVHTDKPIQAVREAAQGWHDVQTIKQLGLPAPIKQLLQQLSKGD